MDKNKLLLLGLNLLNKGLKLPYAVVRPQTKAPVAERAPSQLIEKLKSSPPSPQMLSALLVEGVRKRKRDPDDDLSEVGRREKRKMMNRVSAQNARDRRRVYVEELEKKIALLEDKNKKLEEENMVLKQHTSTLSQENEQLGQKLNTSIQPSDSLQALLKETLLQEPLAQGSAVPPHKVSQQQKQFLKQWILLQIFLTFNLSYWQPSSKTSSQPPVYLLEEEALMPMLPLSNNHQPLLGESPWWGAQNSKWSPPKN